MFIADIYLYTCIHQRAGLYNLFLYLNNNRGNINTIKLINKRCTFGAKALALQVLIHEG